MLKTRWMAEAKRERQRRSGRTISLFSAYCFPLLLYDTLQTAKEPPHHQDTMRNHGTAAAAATHCSVIISCSARSEYQFHARVDLSRPLAQRTPILSLFLNLKLMCVHPVPPLTNNCRVPPLLLLRCRRVDKKKADDGAEGTRRTTLPTHSLLVRAIDQECSVRE